MKNVYTNNKIKLLILGVAIACVVSLGVFVQSCSQEDDSLSTNMANYKDAIAIASPYLELVVNQYVLKLSEEKAFSLGISKIDYDRMQEEVRSGNALIVECQANKGEIALNDPQKTQVNASYIRLKDDGELITPGNSFETDLGSSNGSSAWAPLGATQIQITASGACLLTGVNGYIYCNGQKIYYSVGGLCGGTGTYNLPFSNTNVTVTGTTNCSNGAYVTFAFITYTKK